MLGLSFLEQKYFDVFGTEENSNFYDSEIFLTSAKLEAEKYNCSMHQMFGFSKEMIKEQFEVANNFEPKAMFTLEKPNSENKLLNIKYLDQIEI